MTAPRAEVHEFDAEIEAGRGGGAYVRVPLDARETFGSGGQVRVHASFDGEEYRGSIAPMGGRVHVLGIRKWIRAAIGKDVGDRVRVRLRRDTEERTVDLPLELAAALERSPAAKGTYEALAYTHRREYAEWVAEAKRQTTRDRRAAQTIERLSGGES